MQEFKVKIEEREYILNNNSGKYDRVFDVKLGFGQNPTNEQILAFYDKFGGLILDENRKKIENGQFWKIYEEKLTREKQWKESWEKKKEMAGSFVEFIEGFKGVLWLVIFLIFVVALFFGQDKIISVIKYIKEVI